MTTQNTDRWEMLVQMALNWDTEPRYQCVGVILDAFPKPENPLSDIEGYAVNAFVSQVARMFETRNELPGDEAAAPNVTVLHNYGNGSREAILKKYSERPAKEFVQIDTWCQGRWQGDSVINCDDDGDSQTSGSTVELMQGSDVRILISPDTDPKDVVRLLRKAADWVDHAPEMIARQSSRKKSQVATNEADADRIEL